MVYNGGFELWSINWWPDYWYFDWHGTRSWECDATEYIEGNYSAKVISTSDQERLVLNNISAKAVEGETYILRLWVLDRDSNARVQACIRWYTEGGSFIGESLYTNFSTDSEVWQELYAVTTAPAESTWVYPQIRIDSATGDEVTINLDGVSIFNPCQPISTPTPLPMILGSGDYNGDGTSDVVIYRPRIGLWAIKGLTRLYFGTEGDVPVSGDYNGDGTTNITVFRGDSGLWAIRGITRIYFGYLFDIPIPGDYDGDDSCDVGIFRGDNGLWAIKNITRLYYGSSDDLPVPGDYDGDGTREVALYNQDDGLWMIKDFSILHFGSGDDRPIPDDYNGDGSWECGIFRPSSGLWAIRGVTRAYFGSGHDQSLSADFNGDSTKDMVIFRGLSGLWAVKGITRIYYGRSGDLPATR